MAFTKYRYRIRCITDDKYEYVEQVFAEAVPTACPVNGAHTIDTVQTTIAEQI